MIIEIKMDIPHDNRHKHGNMVITHDNRNKNGHNT